LKERRNARSLNQHANAALVCGELHFRVKVVLSEPVKMGEANGQNYCREKTHSSS
jgi:hypothetical protein